MEILEQLDILENWKNEDKEVVNEILKQNNINYTYDELENEDIYEIIDEIKSYYELED